MIVNGANYIFLVKNIC